MPEQFQMPDLARMFMMAQQIKDRREDRKLQAEQLERSKALHGQQLALNDQNIAKNDLAIADDVNRQSAQDFIDISQRQGGNPALIQQARQISPALVQKTEAAQMKAANEAQTRAANLIGKDFAQFALQTTGDDPLKVANKLRAREPGMVKLRQDFIDEQNRLRKSSAPSVSVHTGGELSSKARTDLIKRQEEETESVRKLVDAETNILKFGGLDLAAQADASPEEREAALEKGIFELYTLQGRVETKLAQGVDMVGLSSPEQKKRIQATGDIRRALDSDALKQRKIITGVAGPEKEMREIMGTLLQTGLGPTEMFSAFKQYKRTKKRNLEIRDTILADKSIKVGSPEYRNAFSSEWKRRVALEREAEAATEAQPEPSAPTTVVPPPQATQAGLIGARELDDAAANALTNKTRLSVLRAGSLLHKSNMPDAEFGTANAELEQIKAFGGDARIQAAALENWRKKYGL